MVEPWESLLERDPVPWLLASEEPWTRYRVLRDLLGRPESDLDVKQARAEVLRHSQVQGLVAEAARWGERPLKRHNDASHTIYALSALADFGLRADDPDMAPAIEAVMAHQSPEGAYQSVLNIAPRYGGTGEDIWAWMACDAPTLLYALLTMGMDQVPHVQLAVGHLADLVEGNGWRCVSSPEAGKFSGPGRKADPCPIANVYALKALSQAPEMLDSDAARKGAEMLLWHWEHQRERKLYLFGIGTDFRKLKYPFVWYDILHVVDVLTRFPFARGDPRLGEMIRTIAEQADVDGRFTAASMYRAWKGWSFADKKHPSPWLTMLCYRAMRRWQERE